MDYFYSTNPHTEKLGEGDAAERATTESQLPTEPKQNAGEDQSGLMNVPDPT